MNIFPKNYDFLRASFIWDPVLEDIVEWYKDYPFQEFWFYANFDIYLYVLRKANLLNSEIADIIFQDL